MSENGYQDAALNGKRNKTFLYELGYEQMHDICSEVDEILLEFQDVEFPKKVHDEFEKVVSAIKSNEKKRRRHKAVKKHVSRVAAFIVVIGGVGSVVTMSVEAVRVKVFNMFLSDQGTYTEIVFIDEDGLLPPEDLSNFYFPTYMAEEYELREYTKNELIQSYEFRNSEEERIRMKVTELEDVATFLAIDTEEAKVTQVDIHGNQATCVEKLGLVQLVWTENGKQFHMYGYVPLGEMVRIAESVKWFD